MLIKKLCFASMLCFTLSSFASTSYIVPDLTRHIYNQSNTTWTFNIIPINTDSNTVLTVVVPAHTTAEIHFSGEVPEGQIVITDASKASKAFNYYTTTFRGNVYVNREMESTGAIEINEPANADFQIVRDNW